MRTSQSGIWKEQGRAQNVSAHKRYKIYRKFHHCVLFTRRGKISRHYMSDFYVAFAKSVSLL